MAVDKFLLENLHHAFASCIRVVNAIAEDEQDDTGAVLTTLETYDAIVYKALDSISRGHVPNEELIEVIDKLVDYIYRFELYLMIHFTDYYNSVV